MSVLTILFMRFTLGSNQGHEVKYLITISCVPFMIFALTVANGQKRIVPVVVQAVDCESFTFRIKDKRTQSICVGYQPLPNSILGADAVPDPELEPLLPSSDPNSQPGLVGDSGSKGSTKSPGVLDDVRSQREERVNSELSSGVPAGQSDAEARGSYYTQLLKYSTADLFSKRVDLMASSDCGKDKQPCFPCKVLGSISQDPREIPLPTVLLQVGRTSSLQEIEREAKENNVRAPGEWDRLYTTYNLLTNLQKFESTARARQLGQSISVNRELADCVNISVGQAMALLERNLVQIPKDEKVDNSISDMSVKERITQSIDITARAYRDELAHRGILDPNDTIPLASDRYDAIAKVVNGSAATNPQARRAKGLIGLAVKLGRTLEQQGRIQEADAQYAVAKAVCDISLGLLPVVGLGKDTYEAVLGVSIIDGEVLSYSARGFAIFGVITLGYGDEIAKAVSKLISATSGSALAGIIMRHYDNIVAMVGNKAIARELGAGKSADLSTLNNLRKYLSYEEYSSLIDDAGRLRPEAITRLRQVGPVTSPTWQKIVVRDGSQLQDWNYYAYTINNYAGSFQGRLYLNEKTSQYFLVKTNLDKLKDLKNILEKR